MKPSGSILRERFANASALSRRDLLALAATAPALGRLEAQEPSGRASPEETLKDLMAGNERFVSGKPLNPRRSPADFTRVAEAQSPEAVIIGCSDSRVPPEVLFDQGVGDLFVIRVAGNVVTNAGPVVKGSIAYGVVELGSSLMMVLGHSGCGAVKAALQSKGKPLPQSIVDLVGLVQTGSQTDLNQAIIANVRAGVGRLKEFDPSISQLISTNRVKVVGAVYDLASGRVTVVA
jgi:carbonic anhydrase